MTAYLQIVGFGFADAQAISVASLLNAVVPVVDLVGVGAILWGVYSTAVRQFTVESAAARGKPLTDSVAPPRFAFYLGLGLEFMIAAAAIKTLITPDLQQVGILGGMVVIRGLIGLYPRLEKYKLDAGLPAPARDLPPPTTSTANLGSTTDTMSSGTAPETVSAPLNS